MVRKPKPQPAPFAVHCCICLNQGRSVAMATVIKGYAVCEQHTSLVSQPNFDIFELYGRNQL